ncbi:hypothetical protein N9589_01375 [Flavobacteriaceae bacterium]|nr:hypothetical protein [Flavobacteriaceae bacterium]
MKKLLLLSALIISFSSFGQLADFDFNFNDIKDISSLKLFKKFCFEEGFTKVEEGDDEVVYAHNYNADRKVATVWATYIKYNNTLAFELKRYDNSYKPFELVLDQVKRNCEFYDTFEDNYGNEFVCYSCPNATYKGKIGFFRGKNADYIRIFDF